MKPLRIIAVLAFAIAWLYWAFAGAQVQGADAVFATWQAAEAPTPGPLTAKLFCYSDDPSRQQATFVRGDLIHCKLQETGDIKKRKWKLGPILPKNCVKVSDIECAFTSPAVGIYEPSVTVVDAEYEIETASCRVEIVDRFPGEAQPMSQMPERQPALNSNSTVDRPAQVQVPPRAAQVRREEVDPDVLVVQWANEVPSNNRAFEASMISKAFADSKTFTTGMATSRSFIGADAARLWGTWYAKVERKMREMKADVTAGGGKFSEANFCGHVAKALEGVQ